MWRNVTFIYIILNLFNISPGKCTVDLFSDPDPSKPCHIEVLEDYNETDYSGSRVIETNVEKSRHCKLRCADENSAKQFCQNHQPNFIEELGFKAQWDI